MSMKYLGEHFDIHTGGIDHVPIHHTNEIAQSEGATGRKWVNYWLHNEFLVVSKDKDDKEGGAKMSKSAGNFLRLQTLIDKGYHPLDYRYFLLGTHYRKQIYFSWEAMDGAKSARKSLVQKVARIVQAAGGITALNALPAFAKGETSDGSALSAGAKEILSAFRDALENDLSTPVAVSQIQKVVKESALAPAEALSLVARMDSVLALGLLDGAKLVLSAPAAEVSSGHDGDPEAAEIDALVKERVEAKKSKNFARADEIRDELSKRGILVTDTPQGPVWSRR
jgi:cysteinyl-tRNA synthetase